MRVLISGAGIAGPTLAYFLAKTGASITVIERSPELLPNGHSIDIKGSAVAVIKKMGLIESIREAYTSEKGSHFIGSDEKLVAAFPVREGMGGTLSANYEILRADLAGILYKASKGLANVEYRFGQTIEEVVSNDKDSVTVRLDNAEVLNYDLLVLADGQWSRTRQLVFPSKDLTVIDKNMYGAYWTIPQAIQDDEWRKIYIGLQSRIVSTRPDPYGGTRALVTTMPCSDAEREAWQGVSRKGKTAQLELLKEKFADAGWQTQKLLDEAEGSPDFHFQPVQQIKMATWSSERVVCLGDTAYAPSPLTGMGTSLAILGAYVLAGELSKFTTSTSSISSSTSSSSSSAEEHPRRALQEYERKLRPFVEETQKIPSFIPAVAHPKTAFKRDLLHGFLWTVAKVCDGLALVPWVVRMFDREDKEDFPLPRYERLD